MARPRTDFDSLLRSVLASVDESYKGNIYYRKPSNNMHYPAIKYNLSKDSARYANNGKYIHYNRYEVIVIDEDPDSLLKEAVDLIPFATLDRTYETEGLNHFVYTIFF